MTSTTPTQLQLDALREVTNIGCGRAASALSQLVGGRKVEIGVPVVKISPVDTLADLVGGADTKVIAAILGMSGGVNGNLVLILPEDDAHRLAALLLNHPVDEKLTEIGKSALSEAANILASACLSAIGQLTGLKLLPSTPTLTQDHAGAVMDDALSGLEAQKGLVVVLEAKFFTSTTPLVGGQMLLLPEPQGLKTLFSRLGV
jgi:chemotaxis protein CheC